MVGVGTWRLSRGDEPSEIGNGGLQRRAVTRQAGTQHGPFPGRPEAARGQRGVEPAAHLAARLRRGERTRQHLAPFVERGQQALPEALVQPAQFLAQRPDQATALPAVPRHALERLGQEGGELRVDVVRRRRFTAETALEPLQEERLVALQHRIAEVVLAGEVVIERALRHPGRTQHCVHAAGGPAAFEHGLDAGTHQPGPRAVTSVAAFGMAAPDGDGACAIWRKGRGRHGARRLDRSSTFFKANRRRPLPGTVDRPRKSAKCL
ncbi:hypothetical protein Y694_04194 [Methylibium sp. T29-B]|nr:hypothetical protein Y694_04194 [Methylibium sp. T29-B]